MTPEQYPAFPLPSGVQGGSSEAGLTMREWYAAHAPTVPESYSWHRIVGFVGDSENPTSSCPVGTPIQQGSMGEAERMAQWAFYWADHMISAGAKRSPYPIA